MSLTKCADKEYRDKGICVVGLSPGTVATDMQVSIKASGDVAIEAGGDTKIDGTNIALKATSKVTAKPMVEEC